MKNIITLLNAQNFALCLYAFSILFETWDPFGIGIDYLITKITISIYILLTLINFKTFYTLKFVKPFVIPLALLLFVETITGYYHREIGYNDFFNFPLFLNLLIFLVIANHAIIDNKVILKAINAYAAGCVFLSLFYILGIGTEYSFHGRLTIFKQNQNQLGINIAIALLIFIVQTVHTNKIILTNSTLLKFIFIPILISMLAATGSRSAVFCFVFSILFLFILKKTTSRVKKIFLIFGGIISAVGLWQYFMSNSILTDRISSAMQEGDLSGRDVTWLKMMEIIMNNPIFGVGKNGLAYETERIFGYLTSAHNLFIEILVTAGSVGLVLFMIFFTRIIKAAFQIYKNSNDILALTLLIPVIVMVGVGHPLGSKIVYVIFAYIISYNYVLTNDMVKNNCTNDLEIKD